MATSPFNQKIAEQLSNFLKSEAWVVVKYRLDIIYKDTLQKKVNINIENGNSNIAIMSVGGMKTIGDILGITERLPNELMNDKLDADVALSVIENKQRNEEKK